MAKLIFRWSVIVQACVLGEDKEKEIWKLDLCPDAAMFTFKIMIFLMLLGVDPTDRF